MKSHRICRLIESLEHSSSMSKVTTTGFDDVDFYSAAVVAFAFFVATCISPVWIHQT
jgi:hypothetical protein